MEQNTLKVLNDYTYDIFNDCIENDIDKLFYSEHTFRKIAFNNLAFTSLGYTFEYNDPLYTEYITLSDKWLPRLLFGFLPFYLGFLKHLLKPYINETIRLETEMAKLMRQMIDKMDKSLTNDCYVSNMLDTNNKVYRKLSDDAKIADIMDIFVGATDTTSGVLTMSLLLLCMNLNVQNEVRNELLNVFKNDQNFTLKKIKECPKFEALSYECVRLSNIIHMGGPHTMSKDTKVTVGNKEYILPKNCVVVENLSFIHDMNPSENWVPIKRKNKSDFNHTLILSNFLEKENKTNKLKFKLNESFVYFGFGKRDCIGRQLGIKQIQFLLGQLLLKYKFQLPKEYQNISQLKFKTRLVNRVESIGLVIKKV